MFANLIAVAVMALAPQGEEIVGTYLVRGETVFTMAGAPIKDGAVLVRDGKITKVGAAAEIPVPPEMRVVRAAVVMPGLIDAHSTVGLSGLLNIPHDQDQLEKSAAAQPELRALDAFNPAEVSPLVAYLASSDFAVAGPEYQKLTQLEPENPRAWYGLNRCFTALSEASFLSWGWRVAFWLSAVVVLIGYYIRTKVSDAPI